MKFLLHASLFTGLAVNRLKSQQLQPLAQLPGPARFAGQALTQHLPGAVAVASTSVSSEVSAQRWALKTSQWRVEVAQAGSSMQMAQAQVLSSGQRLFPPNVHVVCIQGTEEDTNECADMCL